MKNKIKFIAIFINIFYLEGCKDRITKCKLAEMDIKSWYGNVKVDSIYIDWRNHAHAAIGNEGNIVLFEEGDMLIEPRKGDSLIKDTGTVEYTLIRGDSMYIQKWDCLHMKQVIVASKLVLRPVK
jgi:hypothetical protein